MRRNVDRGGLSVFFPARDEAENIGALVKTALTVLPRVTRDFEVIVVDDGSRDGTGEVVRELASRHPQVRLVRHEDNRGYGAALRSGFEAARHRHVFFSDGDGKFDLAELPEFARPLLDGTVDAVIGWRGTRHDPPRRRLYARGWGMLARVWLGVRARDVNCAFKAMPSALARRLALECVGAAASAEMLAKLARAGCRIVERRVTHRQRVAGRASGGDPRVIVCALRELALARRATSRFRLEPAELEAIRAGREPARAPNASG